MALSALFWDLAIGRCLLASEKPLFFLHLELFPARQSSKLPSGDAKHGNKVPFREVILREKTKFLLEDLAPASDNGAGAEGPRDSPK